jgi:hypothetical protein
MLLVFYALSIMLMVYGLYFFYDTYRPLLWYVTIIPVLFVPFYGIFGSLPVALYNHFRKKKELLYYLDDEELLTPLDEYSSEREDSWEIIKGKKWAQSYFDIMTGDNKALKKLLLKKIMDENLLYGVKLLNIALKDKDYEIRSFAAVVLNKLENDINQKILAAKQKMNKKPEDIQVRLELINMYYSYCINGLTDAGTLNYYINLAASLLDELEQLDSLSSSEKLEVRLWKARIANYRGDPDLESEIYDSILAEYPEHDEALANSCSIAFSGRDFKKLTEKCRQWIALERQANPLSDPIKTWLGKSLP